MENNGMQPPQPTAPTQPGMDVQPPQAPAVNTGWPSAAPPPAAGVGSTTAPAPGVAPVMSSPASPATPAPAPGMAPAPAAWGAPAASAAPAPNPVAVAAPPQPAQATTPDATAGPVPAPTDVATPSADAQSPDQQSADNHNPLAIPSETKAKRKAPIGVIVGAIFVALLLASAAVFAYMKMQNKTTSQQVKMPIIGASDVDKTQSEIDENLAKVDDTKDFAASDLSDAAIGL